MNRALTIVFLFIFISSSLAQQGWTQVGAGFNGYVSALHIDTTTNTLYAGGSFLNSGTTVLNHIGYWDGIQWNPMGIGFDQRVSDIVEYNGELYATGWFNTADTTVAHHIAKWNGSTWEDVGGGLNDAALCMYVFNGNLYVGGFFTSAGNQPCKYIAFWDGATWNSLDTNIVSPMGWPVQTIFSYQGELIIGGKFVAEGVANNIARLNNGIWLPLNAGANGDVSSLNEVNGELIVTGYFSMVDSISSIGVAKWNGNNWISVYGPMSSWVYCQQEHNGNLIFGGAGNAFVNMGWGMLSPGIANYNVAFQTWSGIDSGFSYSVRDLLVVGNTLYAGGSFTQAGNDPALNIAQIDITALSISETPVEPIVNAFPNPASSNTTFQFITGNATREIIIRDQLGRDVWRRVTSDCTVEFPSAEFSSGIYFYTVVESESPSITGKFIIEH